MYGANNQPPPSTGDTSTEKWFECTSREYYDAHTKCFPGQTLMVVPYKKP